MLWGNPLTEDGNSIFERNLNCLNEYHPEIVSLVQKSSSSTIAAPQIHSRNEDEFQPLLITPYEKMHDRIVVSFGTASGKWLLDHYSTISNNLYRLIVLEPSVETFSNLLRNRDIQSLLSDTRIDWLIGPKINQLEQVLRESIVGIGYWGITLYADSHTKEIYTEQFNTTSQIVSLVEGIGCENARTQKERGKFIQHNILRNLPWILRSASSHCCENTLQDVPAVIVGAGPSLNQNIEWLCNASAGVLIISTDTALPLLARNGIQPHIVVACDPLQINLKHFSKFNSLEPMIFAYLPDTYYGILAKFPTHRRLLCLHDLQSKTLQQLAPLLGVQGTFQRSMNVGYCAFALARLLGCSPIILTGMDLAVSRQGRSHAEGTANVHDVSIQSKTSSDSNNENHQSSSPIFVEVEGYDGEPIFTFSYFQQTIFLLEQTIAQMNTLVIDATEGGAKKRGAVQMLLRDALRQHHGTVDISACLDTLFLPRQDIPLKPLVDIFIEKHKEIVKIRNQLEIGKARLQQWYTSGHSTKTRNKELEVFLSRWKEILCYPALDIGIDIGLARWRYETYRAFPPGSLSPAESAEWWYKRLSAWFSGLQEDLTFFGQVYEYVVKELGKVK